MNKKTIVCSMGGGFTSTALMPLVLLNKYLEKQIHFVTCVLPNEHQSTWTLFDSVESHLGIEVTYIAYLPQKPYWQYVRKEDRNNTKILFTPFDIFDKQGFIANSRNDPCSRLLKRETMKRYIDDTYGPERVVMAVGIHNDEIERHIAIRNNWGSKGYETIFPLLQDKSYTKAEQINKLYEWYGVTIELYDYGFAHNNCGGACVKAGQRQWAMLWSFYPDIYNQWETRELTWQENWKRNNTILRITRQKKRIYITLKEFREIILEPARNNKTSGFMSQFIEKLESNPACFWCSSI